MRKIEKRSVFPYESTEEIKSAKAEISLERAKVFIFEMKKLLEEGNKMSMRGMAKHTPEFERGVE